MNTTFCVYCHTNLQNGKRYIGITKQDPERRWRNGDGYKNGAFHNAIMKYGWGGFRHEVLFSELTEAEAKAVGVPATNISRTCRGKRKTAAGYVWEYA